MDNSLLIQNVTLSDLERMIDRSIERRMEAFYERIREKPSILVKRKDAARILGLSLPTIDSYAKVGILHPKHIGGRVYYDQDELQSVRGLG